MIVSLLVEASFRGGRRGGRGRRGRRRSGRNCCKLFIHNNADDEDDDDDEYIYIFICQLHIIKLSQCVKGKVKGGKSMLVNVTRITSE